MNVQYDKDAIFNDLDAVTLCDYLSIPSRRAGSITYIECPNPDHIEQSAARPKHCQLFRDGCHCYACGAHYGLYGLAKNWMEKEGQYPDGAEIYGVLADAAGGREQYIIKGKSRQKIEKFPISDKMLGLLQIPKHPSARSAMYLTSVETDEDGNIISAKEKLEKQVTITSLWKEDKDAFWYIVKTKASQMAERNRELYEKTRVVPDESMQRLASVFKQNETQIREFLINIA